VYRHRQGRRKSAWAYNRHPAIHQALRDRHKDVHEDADDVEVRVKRRAYRWLPDDWEGTTRHNDKSWKTQSKRRRQFKPAYTKVTTIMYNCNGCSLARYKAKYKDRLVKVGDTYYVKGEEPMPGQSEPTSLEDGTPIRFLVWFMSEGHSYDDDCSLSNAAKRDYWASTVIT
jgi:hypothetical protein